MNTLLRTSGILVMCGLLSACAGLESMGAGPGSGQGTTFSAMLGSSRVSAPDGTFSVEVPTDWRVSDSYDAEALLMLHGETEREGLITVRAFPDTARLDKRQIEEVRRIALESLRLELAEVRIEAEKDQRIAGRDVYQTMYYCRLRGVPVVGLYSLLVDASGLYSINAMMQESHVTQVNDAVSLILRTLQPVEGPVSGQNMRYDDPQKVFSFAPPVGWHFEHRRVVDNTSLHRFAAGDGSQARLVVARMETGTEQPQLQELEARLERGLFAQLEVTEPTLKGVQQTQLGGLPARVKIWTFQSQGQTWYLYGVVQPGRSDVMAWAAAGPSDLLSRHEAVFKPSLQSLRFLRERQVSLSLAAW